MNKIGKSVIGASKPYERPPSNSAFPLCGSPGINMRDNPPTAAVKSRASFLDYIKFLSGKNLPQLVLSGGRDSSTCFDGLDKGLLTFHDGTSVSLVYLIEHAARNGILAKDGMLVIDANIFGPTDVAYAALINAALQVNMAGTAQMNIKIVTKAKNKEHEKEKGGVYIFNPDGSVTYEPKSEIDADIESRGCGEGYKKIED